MLKEAKRPLVMFGAASSRPRAAGQLTDFIRHTGIPYFTTQMGKGTVGALGTASSEEGAELWMGTAALSERDYLHEAIDKADLILAIGHDTVEKPPFFMGPNGPKVVHISYTPAHVEEVYFPDAEVVGDVGQSLARIAALVEGKLPNGSTRAHARWHIATHTGSGHRIALPADAPANRS
jgi:acetolactate synthase-1/2/3 large subunit